MDTAASLVITCIALLLYLSLVHWKDTETSLVHRTDTVTIRGMTETMGCSLLGNGRKKVLVIGKTGTGKSSICNRLSGKEYNANFFPTSGAATTCTQQTKFADVDFCGDPSRPLSIIDTIGFDDPSKNHDAKIIAELITTLQSNVDHVNLFLIAVNGQNPRLDGSLLQMLKIFPRMFSEKFWDHVAVVFTRLPMNQYFIERRQEDGTSDHDMAKGYMAEVDRHFGGKGRNLKYFIIDSKYRANNQEETLAFKQETDKLYSLLETMGGLSTDMMKKVVTENQKLKKHIEEAENRTRKMAAEKQAAEQEKEAADNRERKMAAEKQAAEQEKEAADNRERQMAAEKKAADDKVIEGCTSDVFLNLSFYGSNLWELYGASADKLYKSWNVMVRYMFNIPRKSHRFIIEPISGTSHLKIKLIKRFIQFYKTVSTCDKSHLRFLMKLQENDYRSVFGQNVRNICSESETEKISEVNLSKIVYMPIPSEEEWKISLTLELLKMRSGRKESILSIEEIQSIPDQITT